MIGGPYRTNPPFSVSISMKVPWDPMTLVWSSTDTNGGDGDSDLDFLCCLSTFISSVFKEFEKYGFLLCYIFYFFLLFLSNVKYKSINYYYYNSPFPKPTLTVQSNPHTNPKRCL